MDMVVVGGLQLEGRKGRHVCGRGLLVFLLSKRRRRWERRGKQIAYISTCMFMCGGAICIGTQESETGRLTVYDDNISDDDIYVVHNK